MARRMRRVWTLAAVFAVVSPAAAVAELRCQEEYKISYCEQFPDGTAMMTGDRGFIVWRLSRPRSEFLVVDMPDEMDEVTRNVSIMARLSGNFGVCHLKERDDYGRRRACIQSVVDLGFEVPDEGLYPSELHRKPKQKK